MCREVEALVGVHDGLAGDVLALGINESGAGKDVPNGSGPPGEV